MSNKKGSLLVLSLLFLGILVSTTCGCIETSSKSEQVGTNVLGASVVEHQYLFGLMESKYDVQIYVLGATVVDVQGVNKSERDAYLGKHLNK